jgi:hypothetical protein
MMDAWGLHFAAFVSQIQTHMMRYGLSIPGCSLSGSLLGFGAAASRARFGAACASLGFFEGLVDRMLYVSRIRVFFFSVWRSTVDDVALLLRA